MERNALKWMAHSYTAYAFGVFRFSLPADKNAPGDCYSPSLSPAQFFFLFLFLSLFQYRALINSCYVYDFQCFYLLFHVVYLSSSRLFFLIVCFLPFVTTTLHKRIKTKPKLCVCQHSKWIQLFSSTSYILFHSLFFFCSISDIYDVRCERGIVSRW